ncbi:MAG: extracellular solute-binding protein [Limnochordales bacterium]|nr:extracellular solute-binding protein [Limnochordales bacterium]
MASIAFVALIGMAIAGTVPAMAKTQVRLLVWGSSDPYQPIVDQFEKANPDIDVRVEPAPAFGAYLDKLQVEIAAGMAPDVVGLSGAFVSHLAKAGALLSLDSYMARDGINPNDFLPTGDIFRYNGKTYGIGTAYDIVGLLYNQDMFDSAGIQPPDENWTWSSLRTAAAKLTRRTNDKVLNYGVIMYAAPEYWGHASWMNFFAQNGVRPLNSTKTKAAFNTPAGVEAVKFMTDFVLKDRSAPPVPEVYNWDFGKEQVAMDFSILPNPFPGLLQAAKFSWDVAPIPKGKIRAAVTNTVGLGITAQSTVKDAAWRFLKFAVTEGQKIIAARRSWMPVYKPAVAEYLKGMQKPRGFAEVLRVNADYVVDMQFTPSWSQWTAALGTRIAEAVSGQKSPEAALAQAEEEVNRILAQEK